MIKTLIFDVDGTLAETEEQGHRVAFNLAFQDMGFDHFWSEQHYKELLSVAGGKERIQHFWRSIAHPEAENTALIAQLHQLKTKHYVALISHGDIPLRPGVKQLIDYAKANGFTLAIATTTSRINLETLLTATLGPTALESFQFIGCAENAPNKKPAPDVYQLVLENLAVSADQVVAFEDNANGLIAANAAGIQKVVVTPTFLSEHEDFSQAWQHLDDLEQFDIAWLNQH